LRFCAKAVDAIPECKNKHINTGKRVTHIMEVPFRNSVIPCFFTIVLLFGALLAGGCTDSSPAVEAIPTDTMDGPGNNSGIDFTITSYEYTHDIGGRSPHSGHVFLLMTISLTNQGYAGGFDFTESQLKIPGQASASGITYKLVQVLSDPLCEAHIPDGDSVSGQVVMGVEENARIANVLLTSMSGETIASVALETNMAQSSVGEDYSALLDEIQTADPKLAAEIEKLPEVRDGVSDDDLEAVEDIYILSTTGSPGTKEAFELMYAEGIPAARPYCTPLQALLWIAYDHEFDGYNPINPYSLDKLLQTAWRESAISANYTSGRWTDFDEVASRLQSPAIATFYGLECFSYDDELYALWQQGIYPPARSAREVFLDKKGISNEQSRFLVHCLRINGYTYDSFDEAPNSVAALWAFEQKDPPVGHVTCVFTNGTDELYVIDIGGYNRRGIVGPFSSLEEAASATRHTHVGYCLLNEQGKRTYCTC
jgi:hypothetical protein